MLCVDGHDWHHADADAAALIDEALRRLHARRPSYDEGQREYSVSPDYCSWCHSPLEDVPGTRKVSFCSDVCARSAVSAREINHHRNETRAFNAAWEVISRSRHPQRECEECGKGFRPIRMDSPNRFCSAKCHHAYAGRVLARPPRTCPTCKTSFQPATSKQVHCSPACGFAARRTVLPRECRHCGTTFRPTSNSGGAFCSRACHYAHGHGTHACSCSWCGRDFVAKAAHAASCSEACRLAERKFRLGSAPQRLTPHVFDHFVSMPAKGVTFEPNRQAKARR
jgi:hypothetical protein